MSTIEIDLNPLAPSKAVPDIYRQNSYPIAFEEYAITKYVTSLTLPDIPRLFLLIHSLRRWWPVLYPHRSIADAS